MSNLTLFNLVENILNRPLNSFDATIVDNWVNKYGNNYVRSLLTTLLNDVKAMRVRVYSTNYIDTYLYRNYDLYKNILNSIGTTQVESKPKENETKKEETIKNDWDEHSEEVREYWTARLKYVFYPNEYPNPDLNPKYKNIDRE